MTTPNPDASRPADAQQAAAVRAEALRLSRSVPALRRGRARVLAIGLAWLAVGVALLGAFIANLITDPGVGSLVLLGLWAAALVASLVVLAWWAIRERAHVARIAALLGSGVAPDSVASALPDPARPSPLRPLVVSVLVFALVGGALSGAFLAGDAAATAAKDARTGPELLVTDYLDAIAAGDGDAAAEMDDTGARGSLDGADRETFLNGETLATAKEFISKVSANEVGAPSTSDSASVNVGYTLAGERYARTIDVERDGPDGPWRLSDSLAVPLQMATKGGAKTEFLGFGLGGIRTPEADYLGYAAYPGVYELTVDIDEARLAAPAATPVERDYAVAQDDGGLEVVYFDLADD